MLTGSFFNFMVSTNLRFGVGTSDRLSDEIKSLNFNNIAAVIDKAVFEHPQVKKCLEGVSSAGIKIDIFKSEAVEPTYDDLESFRKNFIGKKYDCLAGLGGGSTLDLTKGMAVLLTNDGEAITYRGFPKLKNRPLPVIAIPTTAGSGSEATYNAVFTDDKEKRKLGINSIFNFPVCAIIDPLLTLGCPKPVTVSSGADALVHTLESFVHKKNTLISRMYSKEAFRLLFNNLMRVLDEPDNIEVRSALALGAYLAGIALINAGSGPSGAFSAPLGVHYKVPHGYAGAVFLASITKINVEAGYTDYAQLYELIDGSEKGLSLKEKNTAFLSQLYKLLDKLGIPRSLSHYNLGERDIQFMVEQYEVLKAGIMQNPVEITKEDVHKFMQSLA